MRRVVLCSDVVCQQQMAWCRGRLGTVHAMRPACTTQSTGAAAAAEIPSASIISDAEAIPTLSSSTPSPSSDAIDGRHAQGVRRRRKRLNYADRDTVTMDRTAAADDALLPDATGRQYPPAADGGSAALRSSLHLNDNSGVALGRSDGEALSAINKRSLWFQRLRFWWMNVVGSRQRGVPLLSRALLRPLATPVCGIFVERVMRAFAGTFVAYRCPVSIYFRTSTAPPITDTHRRDDEPDSEGSATTSVASATTSRGLLAECHPSLYVGRSAIHGRGLFSRHALKQGTRVMTEHKMAFVDGIQYLLLLADTHDRIPDTLHYTLPTGRLRECTLHAHAHHLINHSCASNVCVGLSKQFWSPHAPPAALRSVPFVDDPNSFFVTRDVAAGEELTLDYHHRFGHVVLPTPRPLPADAGVAKGQTVGFRGALTSALASPWLRGSLCGPQSSSCGGGRGQQAGCATDGVGGEASSVVVGGQDLYQCCRCGTPSCRGSIFPRTHAEQRTYADVDALTAAGFDDEITMLSRVRDAAAVERHLAECLAKCPQRGHAVLGAAEDAPAAGADEGGRAATTSSSPSTNGRCPTSACSWQRVTMQKRHIVQQYRFVFGSLNTLAPED